MNRWILCFVAVVFLLNGAFSCTNLNNVKNEKHSESPVSIYVELLLDAPIENVFDRLSDHANYNRFPGIDESELLRPGIDHPNDKGALRRIKAGFVEFEEEIVNYDAPVMMEYIIRTSAPFNFDHKLGRIQLEQRGDKTRVVWTSEGDVTTPIIGGLLERKANRGFTKTFEDILKSIEKDHRDLGKNHAK